MTELIYIPVDIVERFMRDVFLGLGVPEKDVRICVDVLITSDLQGIESHGVGRLKYYYDRIVAGVQSVKTETEIIKETESSSNPGRHGQEPGCSAASRWCWRAAGRLQGV